MAETTPDRPPLGTTGVVWPPPRAKRFFFNYFFLLKYLAIGGGRTTPKGHGVASATPDRQFEVAKATPTPNWGGLATFNGVVWHPQWGGQPPIIIIIYF
jgi:hypothetical protein